MVFYLGVRTKIRVLDFNIFIPKYDLCVMRMEELRKGVKRWIVDISNWKPSPDNFSSALSFLPNHLHSSVTRFIQIEDQKRALISRLLQYAVVHQVLQIPVEEIIISRTIQGKPYLEMDQNIRFPNFNFNVTHHGDYVGIASEPLCIVGLDIVSHSRPVQNETIPQFLQQFSSYFSTSEWDKICAPASHCEMLNEFYRFWCVKESFVKAIGSGVGYRLDCVEFDHDNWTNISVKIDGRELKDWKFDLFELGRGHSVCIAKGHPSIATEDYKKTLKQTDFKEEDYHLGFGLPNESFEMLTVEQLLDVFRWNAYRLFN